MKDKQFYIDRAEVCLRGIEKIKAEITKYTSSPKKRAELAEKYLDDLKLLEREYNKARAMYDTDFKAMIEE